MPRNIVFVAPFPAETTMRFLRAVAGLHDVRVLGVVHTPPQGADARLYHDLVRVSDPLSGRELLEAVEVLRRRHGQPARIVGILEALMVQLAEARAAFNVPGTSPRTADKSESGSILSSDRCVGETSSGGGSAKVSAASSSAAVTPNLRAASSRKSAVPLASTRRASRQSSWARQARPSSPRACRSSARQANSAIAASRLSLCG